MGWLGFLPKREEYFQNHCWENQNKVGWYRPLVLIICNTGSIIIPWDILRRFRWFVKNGNYRIFYRVHWIASKLIKVFLAGSKRTQRCRLLKIWWEEMSVCWAWWEWRKRYGRRGILRCLRRWDRGLYWARWRQIQWRIRGCPREGGQVGYQRRDTQLSSKIYLFTHDLIFYFSFSLFLLDTYPSVILSHSQVNLTIFQDNSSNQYKKHLVMRIIVVPFAVMISSGSFLIDKIWNTTHWRWYNNN